MNAFLTIASREVTSRARVLLASLVIGLGTLLVPLLVTTGASPAEMRGASGWFASLLLGLGVAVLTGSALFGAPLAEGRASFWLSRPAPGTSIWAGKLAGAFVLLVLANTLSILPSAIVGTSPFDRSSWPGLLAVDLGLGLFLLLLSAAASVAIRSRSAWIAVDLVALGIVCALGWKAVANLQAIGSFDPLWFVESGPAALLAGSGAALFAACLAVGTWAAVALGRGDIRVAHRAQAIAIWAPLGSLAAAVLAFSAWYAHPPASALRVRWAELAPGASSWLVASGPAAHRPGAIFRFLVDSATGRAFRLDGAYGADVSADGSRAAFLRTVSAASRELQLVCVDLKSPRFVETVVPGSFRWGWSWTEISADGSRLALVADGTLSVLELPSGRLVGSVRLPREAGVRPMPSFRGSSVLLLPQASWEDERPSSATAVNRAFFSLVFDLSTRRLSPPLELQLTPAPAAARFLPSPDGRTVLARRTAEGRLPVDVIDSATGRRLFSFVPGEGTRIAASGFLSDGSVVAVEQSDRSTRVRIFGPSGTERPSIPVPGGNVRFAPAAEVRPGLLAGLILPGARVGGEPLGDEIPRGLALLDVAAGTLRRTGELAVPMTNFSWYGRYGSLVPAGSPAARLFLRDGVLLAGVPGEGPLVPLPLH